MGSKRNERRESEKLRRVTVAPQGDGDPMQRASRNGVYFLQGIIIAAVFLAVCLVFFLVAGRIGFFAVATAAFASIVVASSVHIAQQWERMVVMRLGKFKCVKGPGFFLTMPFVEYSTMRIDVRIRTTAFGAEETLSNDLVPLDVDAVVFWMVHDAEKACVAVDDYAHQLLLSAQTILRDAIGRATAAEVTARRDQLDRELKRLLEEKVSAWGITVLSVEVRNILLPEELQEVMSLEAQAEQKKKARLILMEAESEISAMIEGYAHTYDDNTALELRKMYLLYEGVKEGKGTVVVPSSWNEGFADKVAEDAGK
ncbi:slipin family protein [Eggerthella sinensis]|uniref:Band 7 domain-containing protein n=1 Tax=Eggerthella sinensis TaxID=242230 RepID=A0A3N0J1C9_9ACTN|nr:slipin family protein [Eggerthella sinensis]RDB69281.1 hypothetical protein C1876_07170 [Eggerthella sinensis]RNM43053.1 hypothetical protein DMP09_02040 [Eggerthella sinensis]